MKVLAPIAVTDSMLISSTVPETDHAEWAAGTTYTAGQKVIRLTTHKVYEALTSTTGDTPETSPTKWLDLGATNRWKAFDQKVGTATTQAGSIEWVIVPGQTVGSVGLLELVAESVRVRVSDAIDGIVYDRTQSLTGAITSADWFTYFFEPVSRRPFALFSDLPSYRDPTITITVSGLAGETVKCGVCLLGQWHEFANAVRCGASAGIVDYSKKTADDFGNVQITERAFSKRASWQMLIANNDIDKLQRTLASLRATPALYIGSDRFDATLVYGFYRDFEITIEYYTHSECSIELEGLI
jgi:hypothetical protein